MGRGICIDGGRGGGRGFIEVEGGVEGKVEEGRGKRTSSWAEGEGI